MKIKDFEALTLKECLNQVRQEMGPEAVILETKKGRKGGFLGIGGRELVIITAATGISVNDPLAPRGESSARKAAAQEETPKASPTPAAHPTSPVVAAMDKETKEKLFKMENEISEMKQGIDCIRLAVSASLQPAISPSTVNTEFPELLTRLIQADIPEELALELLSKLPDLSAWGPQARGPLAESALRDLMSHQIPCAGAIKLTPGKTHIAALIGPTGVGKTTTIAKLAAHFALVEKKKVGLLTVDTYRIAAVDQLKTYSQIIDIPVQVAYSQSDITPALESFKGNDLILIDTAGRSQKNVMQVSELKSLVDAAKCETHLVLTASTKVRDMMEQVNRFSSVGVDRLIFSKLDETASYGTIYSVAHKCGIPVSYITTGQKVPEDIETADSSRLAGIVLNSVVQ
jgi:flagellar biosynthesis protein FlhF